MTVKTPLWTATIANHGPSQFVRCNVAASSTRQSRRSSSRERPDHVHPFCFLRGSQILYRPHSVGAKCFRGTLCASWERRLFYVSAPSFLGLCTIAQIVFFFLKRNIPCRCRSWSVGPVCEGNPGPTGGNRLHPGTKQTASESERGGGEPASDSILSGQVEM